MAKINSNALPAPLAEGGEGVIYEIGGKILKLYKPGVNMKEKEAKVRALLSKRLPKNVIAPLEEATDASGKFLGYFMSKVEGEEFKKLGNKKFVQANNISVKQIADMLVQAKETLKILHAQNIYVGDLNDGNLLFDKSGNVFFIDVDSWTVDGLKCTVCMDSFKDPQLKGNDFSGKTDAFAFAVLGFKSFTRLHPFGGTTNPDMDLMERMAKGISVIGNPSVTIPRTVGSWEYFSPELLADMKTVFETGSRSMLDQTLDRFAGSLTLCKQHGGHYFSKFSACPVCDANAKVLTAPVKIVSDAGGIPCIALFEADDAKLVLSLDSYIDSANFVVHRVSKQRLPFESGKKYYFSNDGSILYVATADELRVVKGGRDFSFPKAHKSRVVVRDDKAYFVTPGLALTELTVSPQGNATQTVAKVAMNHHFEIIDKSRYFVCNMYGNMNVYAIDGYNHTASGEGKFRDFGVHYDEAKGTWLFLAETAKGAFVTRVFEKNKIVYDSDAIRYTSELGNVCMSGGVIFKAAHGALRGFDFANNKYKDFPAPIADESSKLERRGKKFLVVNEKAIYQLG